MLKKITAAALSTVMCVSAAIPSAADCSVGIDSTNDINIITDHIMADAAVTTTTAAATTTQVTTTTAAAITTKAAVSTTAATTTAAAVTTTAQVTAPPTLPADEEPVQQGEVGENVKFYLYKDGTIYIKGSGKIADFSSKNTEFKKSAKDIKKAVFINEGDGITNVGALLFCNCPNLEEVILSDTITSIDNTAFGTCPSLKKINLPKSLRTIGVFAFADCSKLESITLPDGLQLIDRYAFNGCRSLKEVVLPETLPTVRAYAFSDCTSITEVTVPEATTTLGAYAFSGCTALKKAVIKGGSEQLGEKVFQKCIALEELTLPNADTAIFRENDAAPLKWLGTLFGDYVSGYTYKVDYSDISRYIPVSLTKITITGGTSISDGAFYGFSSLTSVSIPDSATRIGDDSFKGCSAMSEFKMPSKATYIGSSAFEDCQKINVDIPAGVTEIGEKAFEKCYAITKINVPEATNKIGAYAFAECTSLEKAVISTCKDGIGNNIFYKCIALSDLTLPYAGFAPENSAAKSSSWLGDMFDGFVSGYTYNVQLDENKSAYIPVSLSKITITGGSNLPNDTFYGFSSLTSVSIPDDTAYIGNRSFCGCSNLSEFKMPGSATYIGDSAFEDCQKINVDIPAGVTEIGEKAFEKCYAITKINVPEATNKIGAYAFAECTSVTKAVIATCKNGIGNNIFYKCIALSDLTLPYAGFDPDKAAGKTSSWLGDMFDGFVSGYTYNVQLNETKSAYIPASLSKITITGGSNLPDDTFYGFSSLTSVSIPDDTAYIGNRSFCGCSNLSEFKMPGSATYIGDSAFEDCQKINVDIPKGVTKIGEKAFARCYSIPEINVPEATDRIGAYAFSECTALEKAVIATCKNGIGKNIFNKCIGLQDLTLPYAAFAPEDAAIDKAAWLGVLFGDYVSGYTYKVTKDDMTYYIPASLQKITITGGTVIPDDAFYGLSTLTSVSIPDDTTYIGHRAFCGCSGLSDFNMPSKNTFIGIQAFENCSKLNTDIPAGVTEIGEKAFAGCRSVTEINVPEATKKIGSYAFAECTSMSKAVINGDDTDMGDNCFYKCIGLSSLTLPYNLTEYEKQFTNATDWFKDLFGGYVSGYTYAVTDGDDKIYVPASLKDVVITCGNELPAETFMNFNLENITLPKTVETIGDNAFKGCSSIMNVFYPDTQEAWDKVSVGENNDVLNDKLRVLGDDGEYHNVITRPTTATTTALSTTITTATTTTAPVTTPVSNDYSLGDVDNNKAVNAVDASAVLTDYAMTSTNKKSELTEAQKKAADVDGNSDVNAVDASYILEYYAYSSTVKDKPMTMSEFMADKKAKTK